MQEGLSAAITHPGIDAPVGLHIIRWKQQGHQLTAQDCARFKSDGALLIQGLLSPSDFQGIQLDLAQRLRLLGEPEANAANLTSLSQGLISLSRQDATWQGAVYEAMGCAPSIHALAAHPSLLSAVTQLLSPAVSVHPRTLLLMSLPETHWHLAGWHQDWYYNKGPGSTLTIYAPLQDTTGQNGSLQLALGEHHRGPLPHDDHPTEPPTKWHTLSPREVAGFTRVVDTELAVGDVLLFNSLVPHTARVNRSESVRFVVNLRYQDLADPTFLETRWQVAPSPEARQAMARTSP